MPTDLLCPGACTFINEDGQLDIAVDEDTIDCGPDGLFVSLENDPIDPRGGLVDNPLLLGLKLDPACLDASLSTEGILVPGYTGCLQFQSQSGIFFGNNIPEERECIDRLTAVGEITYPEECGDQAIYVVAGFFGQIDYYFEDPNQPGFEEAFDVSVNGTSVYNRTENSIMKDNTGFPNEYIQEQQAKNGAFDMGFLDPGDTLSISLETCFILPDITDGENPSGTISNGPGINAIVHASNSASVFIFR